MSLSPSQLLKPRETLEVYNGAFEDRIKDLDLEAVFKDVHGMETVKRILIDLIRAHDPIHYIIAGPPGSAKSLILKCFERAFPEISKFIDSTTSSGVGMLERVWEKGPRLRFLLIDELEKFDKDDREVLLGLLEGTLTRDLKNASRELRDLKIFMIATSNDISFLKKYEKPLMSRLDIITVPELDYQEYLHVANLRLQKERGIDNLEIARFIAQRVFSDLGEEKDIRKCIRTARKAYSRSLLSTEGIITEDIVDDVVADQVVVNTLERE